MGHGIARRNQAWVWVTVLGFYLLGYAGMEAEAGPLYVYTDAQGQAVLTDNLDQVPAAYRGRVRTMTGPDSSAPLAEPVPATSAANRQNSKGITGDLLDVVAAKLGTRAIKGLTPYQTAVAIVAGTAAVLLLLLMFLSANPAIRLLCKFCLVLVAGAALFHAAAVEAPSLETVAGPPQQGAALPGDNMLGRMRSRTEQSYRVQDERTVRQLEPAEQPAP